MLYFVLAVLACRLSENIGLTVDCLDQADTTYTYQNSELEKPILNLGHKQFDILFSTRSSVSILLDLRLGAGSVI